jgi:hypothetical protein
MNHYPGQPPEGPQPWRVPMNQLRDAYQERTSREVAEQMGTTPDALRQRLSRAGIRKREK